MLLNPAQRKAVESESPLIAVIAAAGSGKTYVLIERIYNLVKNKVVNPARIKPITFTRKAAGELKERLEKLNITGVKADTFHSFCYALINGYATRLGYRHPVNAYDEHLSSSILVDIMISHNLPYKNVMKNERLRFASVRIIRNAVDKIYNEHPEQWIQIDDEYRHRLKTYNAVDYTRMISETIRLLKSHDDVRAEIHNTWHHFMVDEFQDTDPDQMELLDLIEPKNLFVIGDYDQSIYGFRRARPENINKIVSRDKCELIHLDTNYRCATSIIERSNELIHKNPNELRVDAKPRDDAEPGVCIADGGGGDVWANAALLTRELSQFCRFDEIAILCRDNGRPNYAVGCHAVVEALKRSNVPVKRIIRDGSIWESYEVRNIIYTIELMLNPTDRAAWSMAVDFPFKRIGQADRIQIKKSATMNRISLLEACKGINEKLDDWAVAIQAVGSDLKNNIYSRKKTADIFEEIISAMKWREHFGPLIGKRFHFIIERIKMQMKTLAKDGMPTLLDFIEWWLSREAIEENPTLNAVEVSTIHSYKGLQKRFVIIPGVDEDHFPKTSKKNMDIFEERRVLYVGITRAEEECYLLFSDFPSMFVHEAGFFRRDVEQDEIEQEFLT